jgi:glycosyltransferase involved in cell wall biosynthesis
MKVGFVNDAFLSGRGTDRVIYEIAKRIGKKHEVTIICGKSNIRHENFSVKELGFEKLVSGSVSNYFNSIKNIRKCCKDLDVINLHHASLNLAFLGFDNVVTTYHGSPFMKESERNPVRFLARGFINKVNLFSLRFDKKIIAISNYMKDVLKKNLIPENKISVIPNGIDTSKFKPTWEDKGYMLFVGRHEPHKRIDELIKLSKIVSYPLVIAGSGSETKRMKELAKKIKAPVKFVGRVSTDELVKLYQNCSFFVSSSRWEGFGLIFLEAAACGKPSIGYNICAIPEVIKNGETGFLVKNFSEFLEKIKLLRESKNLREKMGKNARKFSKKFSWKKTVKEYEKIFREVVS